MVGGAEVVGEAITAAAIVEVETVTVVIAEA